MSSTQVDGQVNTDGQVIEKVILKFDGLGSIAFDLPEGEAAEERYVRISYIGRIGKKRDGPDFDGHLGIKGYSRGREVGVDKATVELKFLNDDEVPA